MTESGARGEPPADASAGSWKSFYDSLHPNLEVMRLESREYVRKLERLNLISADSTILDFGCGAGFIAQMLAPKVKKISLWDISATMQRLALSHTAGCPNVTFLDLSDFRGPEVRQTFDLILVNSVIQYMELGDLSLWLSRWRQMLREHGKVIISDIITPDGNPFRDLGDILQFWLRNGIASAFMGLIPMLIRYRQAHQLRPLLRMEKETLTGLSGDAGFKIEFQPNNLTHFRTRNTVILSA